MDQAAAARRRLETMEARTHSLCRTATPRRRPGPGGTNRRQPTWPLAAQQQPRAYHRLANRLLRVARLGFRRGTASPHNPPNRRIRTRTYGGVGGAESRGSPLSHGLFLCRTGFSVVAGASCSTSRLGEAKPTTLVIAGLVPATPDNRARPCHHDRGCRDGPGNDHSNESRARPTECDPRRDPASNHSTMIFTYSPGLS